MSETSAAASTDSKINELISDASDDGWRGSNEIFSACHPMRARPATTQMTYLFLSNFEMDPFVATAAAGCGWQKNFTFMSALLGRMISFEVLQFKVDTIYWEAGCRITRDMEYVSSILLMHYLTEDVDYFQTNGTAFPRWNSVALCTVTF